jgi:hypothetical protein
VSNVINLSPATEEQKQKALQDFADRNVQLSPGAQRAVDTGLLDVPGIVEALPDSSVKQELLAYKAAKARTNATDQQMAADKAKVDNSYWLSGDPSHVRDAETLASLPQWQDRIQNNITGLQNQQAPQMAGAQMGLGPQDQFRTQQMSLAQQLNAAAQGQGPSAAQAQLQLGTDRNMNQALALALGARGGNQAGALKQAGMQRAMISQDASLQSAALRAQEQQAAQQALGNVLTQGRGADINIAGTQAGLDQSTQQANLGATLAQRQMTADKVQQYTGMGLTADQAQQMAQLDAEKHLNDLTAQGEQFRAGLAMANKQSQDQFWHNLSLGMMNAGTSMMSMGATGGK